MTDIVERLRAQAWTIEDCKRLPDEAAEEIEWLRVALDLAYAALRQIADEDIHGDLKDAINKALRHVPQCETSVTSNG